MTAPSSPVPAVDRIELPNGLFVARLPEADLYNPAVRWALYWPDGRPLKTGWSENDARAFAATLNALPTPGRAAEPDTMGEVYWRCFHCDETFTKAQEKHARDHFGATECDRPVCLIREPGEYAVLRALRKAEDDLASYRAEDQDILRAMWSMSADHRQALIREEERGYAKGLADAKLEVTRAETAEAELATRGVESFGLGECIRIAKRGFDAWAAKDHNRRWFRKIDGTPIPNDLSVNIAEAFADALSNSKADR